MLSQRLYYQIKPFLPWSLRMTLRRISARRRRRACQAIWPIDESAVRPPEGWPGWPDGKKFAIVLTHDVEGPEGLEKCLRLAELEMGLGFRSSFNLIPEGPYTVPPALRSWLADRGFEAGVHDLHHDGKLFGSREGFARKAGRINWYLRDWGAAGFRSGFMLRNLDWIHDLDLRYDSSTFDTDPFELQSEGAGTIFPFWVPRRAGASPESGPRPESRNGKVGRVIPNAPSAPPRQIGDGPPFPPSDASATPGVKGGRPDALAAPQPPRGYVELPYTLPQDSTLFLLLREKSPEIWLKKLDWIADHGGMALVNVHPDYLRLDGEAASSRTYSAELYFDLLRHVADRYNGQFWNPVPRVLTGWFNAGRSAQSRYRAVAASVEGDGGDHGAQRIARLRGKRAAVLLYSYYPFDPRPRRAAEAMIGAGMEVDLFCLSESKSEPSREIVGGVRVFRLPMKHRRDNKWTYFRQYGRFLVSSFWFLTRHGFRRKYDFVHVHNMPDFLVFAAVVPKLRGARIILDLHDPMPELMMSIYGLAADEWKVRILRRLEHWSIGFANHALTPNVTFRNLFVSRSCPSDKIQIVMNSPQPEIFDGAKLAVLPGHGRNGQVFRVMHHGLIAHRHGIDLLVRAIAKVRTTVPNVQLDLYGARTPFLDAVLDVARQLDVGDVVRYHGVKPQTEIARAIEETDLGVVPNRRSAFTELNLPTRIFEYLAMGRPVVAPATQGIKDYFNGDQLLMFEPDNVDDLAAKILWVVANPAAIRESIERGVAVYRTHLWSDEKARLLTVTAGLLER